MKKLIVAIAALVIAVSASAQAGLVIGMTSSETEYKAAAANAKDVTLFHAGVAFKLPLPFGFAVQPALIYNMKGTSASGVKDGEPASFEYKAGFLELPVQAQWGINLAGVVRPYVFAEPFVGYAISGEEKISDHTGSENLKQEWDNVKTRLEYGIGVGFGVELFNNLQLSVRKFWNMGNLYNGDQAAIENFQSGLDNAVTTAESEQCDGIMASITILF